MSSHYGKVSALGAALLLAMASAGAQSTSVDPRITRVETGLLPRAVARGAAGQRMSIAERMAYHGIPGASVAVVQDGRVEWARAYGVVDRDTKAPVNTETLFQAASLSKPVSALGALRLVQDQRVDLDTDLRQWLRSWKPDRAITLRQLLSHTAGLTVSGFSGYTPGAPLPTALQILEGAPPANNAAVRVTGDVGTAVSYSGGGFVGVQQLFVDITGSSFAELMRRSVLAPLQMTHSTFEQPLPPGMSHLAASGYRREGAKLDKNWMVHPELAAAGLWTTPSDLAQVIIELQDALAGRPARILTPASAREMLTARVGNAGLGIFLAGPNGTSRRFLHTGRNAGFDALLVGYKNGRQGAVVMINRNNNERFIDEVVESIAREYGWPDYGAPAAQREYEVVAPEVQSTYAGTYDAAGHPVLVVVFEDQKLFARSGDDAWFRLYPASASEFFAIDDDARWTFVRGAGGAVTELVVKSSKSELRRRRR
jgi:CubicO group peptidase (beta-lactamase class C family)